MSKKLLFFIAFACMYVEIHTKNDHLLPKSIQLSFISQQDKTNTNDITAETLYCIETLQGLSHIQDKRPLTFEEIIVALKVLIYLHTNDSPYQQGIVAIVDEKAIALPFSKQLFAEIIQQNNNAE